MFGVLLFLGHSLIELLASFFVGTGKSASDNLLSEEDKKSLKNLTTNATFISVTKKGRYLGKF